MRTLTVLAITMGLSSSLVSHTVEAVEFGLGPCCSGAPCGIIPCDSMCAGPAIGEMGRVIGGGFNMISQQANSQSSNITNTDDSYTELLDDMGDNDDERTTVFEEGFDMLATQYSGSRLILNKQLLNSLIIANQTITLSLKGIDKFETIQKTETNLGQMGQPVFIDNILDNIELHRAVLTNEHQKKSLLFEMQTDLTDKNIDKLLTGLDLFGDTLTERLLSDERVDIIVPWDTAITPEQAADYVILQAPVYEESPSTDELIKNEISKSLISAAMAPYLQGELDGQTYSSSTQFHQQLSELNTSDPAYHTQLNTLSKRGVMALLTTKKQIKTTLMARFLENEKRLTMLKRINE